MTKKWQAERTKDENMNALLVLFVVELFVFQAGAWSANHPGTTTIFQQTKFRNLIARFCKLRISATADLACGNTVSNFVSMAFSRFGTWHDLCLSHLSGPKYTAHEN
jgi:hypothetical protein